MRYFSGNEQKQNELYRLRQKISKIIFVIWIASALVLILNVLLIFFFELNILVFKGKEFYPYFSIAAMISLVLGSLIAPFEKSPEVLKEEEERLAANPNLKRVPLGLPGDGSKIIDTSYRKSYMINFILFATGLVVILSTTAYVNILSVQETAVPMVKPFLAIGLSFILVGIFPKIIRVLGVAIIVLVGLIFLNGHQGVFSKFEWFLIMIVTIFLFYLDRRLND